jgi:DNA-binding NarL/FixJ family response regulator
VIRVVLADDQTLVRQGIRGLLELSKRVTVVAEAEDGPAALKAIEQARPDVALLDVRMPIMSGLKVTSALRAKGNRTAVVLLTTFDDEAVLREGMRLGIAGYLLKDVGSDQLVDALETVATGGTLILPAAVGRAERELGRDGVPFESSTVPQRLTAREIEVLRLMVGGYSNREIADALGTAEGTVKNQASSILLKLGVRDRTRAVLKALEIGLLVSRANHVAMPAPPGGPGKPRRPV